jgi:CRP/FNR family transcriptional regulator
MWSPGGNPGHPLTEEERALLAVIATVVRYKKGETIYKEGGPVLAVFNLIAGVAKSYAKNSDDQRPYIVGFLFPNDLFGLAESGKYVNSAEAVTPVTAYKIPIMALEARLRNNPTLDFQVIAKLCHDLREAQRHAFLLSKHRSIVKVGFFIQMLETMQAHQPGAIGEVYLPMSRSDIAAYTAMSPEAVSRSFSDLVSRGAISLRDRRHVKIIDRALLEAVVSGSGTLTARRAFGN